MKVLGADIPASAAAATAPEGTVVLLDPSGRVAAARAAAGVPGVAQTIADLAGDEAFLAAVGVPVVVPEKPTRLRPVDRVLRRRLGFRIPPAGRAALRGGVPGEALLAALAAGGHPCLPYPDRDLRRSGLAEAYAELTVKALLWEGSALAAGPSSPQREEAFRSLAAPPYRSARAGRRSSWAERAAALEIVLRAVGSAPGLDAAPARAALAAATTEADVERAASLFDATLLAFTARRYLESPEACVFLGDRHEGYAILPADGFVRRLALREARPGRGQLFPAVSLGERLGTSAEVHPAGLLALPGRPQQLEVVFRDTPLYEFDNLDEMLWWKHCRHLAGPVLPTEGLREIIVRTGSGIPGEAAEAPVRLVRSRHSTLSFRFDPPAAWRARIPTRDGKTYPFRIVRALYDTSPAAV